MSNKSGVSKQIISLPQGGGSLQGIGETFSPDLHTGTGNFSVPVALPPGRNGFQPDLELVYSSGNGNGSFGLGWALSVPAIIRKTSQGVPIYDDETDTFILSGAEDLVAVAQDEETGVTQYRPRTEGLFAKIEHHKNADQDFWKVWSKDGLISFYGAAPSQDAQDSAIISNPEPNQRSQIFAWKLTRTQDPFGNLIEYDYEKDSVNDGTRNWAQLYLKRIRYVDYGDPNNLKFLVSVTFEYEDRPDPFSEYRSGFEIRTRKRCKEIVIQTHVEQNNYTVRCYRLRYLDQRQDLDDLASRLPLNGTSLLNQIWVMGKDSAVENLLKNPDFDKVGPQGLKTSFTGQFNAGFSAAQDWRLWNNKLAEITTELIPSTFGGGGSSMVHLVTTGAENGLVQVFLPDNTGPATIVAGAWVYVKRGKVGIGTGNGGRTKIDITSSSTNRWEYLQAENGGSPANEFIIYSVSEGGAEFYVAGTSVSEQPRVEWLPPLEFNYTDFTPEQQGFQAIQGQGLPAQSLADSNLELADLFGNGLPDILEMNSTVRYWRNLGNGKFDLPRHMKEVPAGLQLADPGVQLVDANGDGRIDLLVKSGVLAGYYSTQPEAIWDRRSFHAYQQAPSINLEDPEVQMVDLTGNGVIDAIRSGSRLECFFNDPKQGWTNTKRIERKALADFPNVNFSDPRVKWGDMTGDGLQDILLVYDGNIEYWPNLGYGNWGKRIRMVNSPRFRYGYDPRRILVGDVDGDGVADLVYVDDRKVILWINQNGNGWSEPIEIRGTPPVSDIDAVRLVDLLGTGVGGILWSRNATELTRNPMHFLDFTGGVKPYLLNEMNNHMGTTTKVGYVPSTKFYIEDQQKQQPWKTTLPFPLHVVDRVEVIDEISQGKLTTEYRYHHGYWDGVEREFRGFGRVEQFDSESFDVYNAPGLHDDTEFTRVEKEQFSPPTRTVSWFHVGPVGNEEGHWYELDYSEEFWVGDAPVFSRSEETEQLLKELPRKVQRDALRTLRGLTLRTELYAMDGSQLQDRPYTVSESLFGLREEVPTQDKRRQHIFFPYVLSQRTSQWERGDDPMTQLNFSWDYDTFGQVRANCTIAVPRGRDFRVDDPNAQEPYLTTYSRTDYAKPSNKESYIHDRISRNTSWEVKNDGRLSAWGLKNLIEMEQAQLEIISQSLSFYDGDEYEGAAFGQVGYYGAMVRSETLILTEDIIQEAYGSAPMPELPPELNPNPNRQWTEEYPQAFRDALPIQTETDPTRPYLQMTPAGYGFSGGEEAYFSSGYFVATERISYDFHRETEQGRGLTIGIRDPLGRDTKVDYDGYALMPITVTDPLGLQEKADYNYRVFQPWKTVDVNNNQKLFRFTPLGMTSSIAIMGKQGENVGDTPEQPSTFFYYDFLAWFIQQQPVWIKTVQREYHENDMDVALPKRDQAIQKVEFSDGFGRIIQTRAQAEDVIFGDTTFGQGGLPADQSLPVSDSIGIPATADSPFIRVSGWQIYDNKGQIIIQYEPFFATGWDYAPPITAQYGQKVRSFYDPRGRVIRVILPDDSESRTIYGIPIKLDKPEIFRPSPWETYFYDANDNAGRTHPTQSAGYQEHWNTPAHSLVDALGRITESVERNGSGEVNEYVTRSFHEIRGNLIRVQDALGRNAFSYVYNLRILSEEEQDKEEELTPIRVERLDAGPQVIVQDAAGNEIERRDSRGALILSTYDQGQRPTSMWARDLSGESITLREKIIYGDTATEFTRSEALKRNLIDAVHHYYDEAGLLIYESYDFKGNVLEQVRRVISEKAILAVFDQPPLDWKISAFRADWQSSEEDLLGTQEYRTSQQFDALDRPIQIIYPEDVEKQRRHLEVAYNRSGLMDSLRVDGEVYVQHIAYTAQEKRSLIAYGNGIMMRYAYDETGNLLRLRSERYQSSQGNSFEPQGRPLQDFSYEYDLSGNVVKIKDRAPDSGIKDTPQGKDALDRIFTYDALYRLISANGRECGVTPPLPWDNQPRCQDLTKTRAYTESYSYDKLGNLVKLDHRGQNNADFIREFSIVPNSNQLENLTTRGQTYFYSYDSAGNMIGEGTARHFEWDHSNRMRLFRTQTDGSEPSVCAHYVYDETGQRVMKLVRKQGGIVEVTVYIGDFFEHHFMFGTSSELANNTVHIMAGASRIATIRAGNPFPNDKRPSIKYYLGDILGSSNVVTDQDGRWINKEEFTPYGETSFGGYSKKRYRFTGQERDEESGLSYHQSRYLSVSTTRFLSVDPIHSINSYWYSDGNPTSYTDIYGAQPNYLNTPNDADTGIPNPTGITKTDKICSVNGKGHKHIAKRLKIDNLDSAAKIAAKIAVIGGLSAAGLGVVAVSLGRAWMINIARTVLIGLLLLGPKYTPLINRSTPPPNYSYYPASPKSQSLPKGAGRFASDARKLQQATRQVPKRSTIRLPGKGGSGNGSSGLGGRGGTFKPLNFKPLKWLVTGLRLGLRLGGLTTLAYYALRIKSAGEYPDTAWRRALRRKSRFPRQLRYTPIKQLKYTPIKWQHK